MYGTLNGFYSTEWEFKDIVLHEEDCENMRIVGEFVTVLEE